MKHRISTKRDGTVTMRTKRITKRGVRAVNTAIKPSEGKKELSQAEWAQLVLNLYPEQQAAQGTTGKREVE